MIKHIAFAPLIIAVVLLSSGLLYSQDDTGMMPVEGRWLMDIGGIKIYEIWEKQADGSLKGISYLLEDGDSTFLEALELKSVSGKIIYSAVIEGQNEGKPVDFELTGADDNIYIFENNEHDFPQKIVYELRKNGVLNASISGKKGDKTKTVNFNYKKITE